MRGEAAVLDGPSAAALEAHLKHQQLFNGNGGIQVEHVQLL